jgi:hypothetical protein
MASNSFSHKKCGLLVKEISVLHKIPIIGHIPLNNMDYSDCCGAAFE